MNTQLQLKTDTCLLIFDPHQDVAWLRAIIGKERRHVSHVLLGGDYFDTTRTAGVATVEETCAFLRELAAEWGNRLTVLLGNHDVHYIEAKRWCDKRRTPRFPRYKCSGFTNNKAKAIAKALPWEFWRRCRLFQVVNGWLVSHAGVAGAFWPPADRTADSLRALDAVCTHVAARLPYEDFPLLHAGRVRGGTQAIGGITWLDFNFEFSDDEVPLPQVFGHTSKRGGLHAANGRSHCLDGAQTCYGILRRDGSLQVITGL